MEKKTKIILAGSILLGASFLLYKKLSANKTQNVAPSAPIEAAKPDPIIPIPSPLEYVTCPDGSRQVAHGIVEPCRNHQAVPQMSAGSYGSEYKSREQLAAEEAMQRALGDVSIFGIIRRPNSII